NRHFAVHGGGGARENPTSLVSQKRTTYVYDKAGNVVAERYIDIGLFPGQADESFYANTTAAYDALGRLTHWQEHRRAWGPTYITPPASMDYQYDASGNIRRSTSSFMTFDPHGYVTGSSSQDYWYRYDLLNRVVTQKGVLSGGAIVRGSNGVDVAYDL